MAKQTYSKKSISKLQRYELPDYGQVEKVKILIPPNYVYSDMVINFAYGQVLKFRNKNNKGQKVNCIFFTKDPHFKQGDLAEGVIKDFYLGILDSRTGFKRDHNKKDKIIFVNKSCNKDYVPKKHYIYYEPIVLLVDLKYKNMKIGNKETKNAIDFLESNFSEIHYMDGYENIDKWIRKMSFIDF